MQILINTDHNIEGHVSLADHVREIVKTALARFTDRITRVEVHLTDESGDKHRGNDKRCMLEARLAGQAQAVAREHAGAARRPTPVSLDTGSGRPEHMRRS